MTDLGKASYTFYVCVNCSIVGRHVGVITLDNDTSVCKKCSNPVQKYIKYFNILDTGRLYDIDAHIHFANAGQMVNYYDDAKPFHNS